MPVTAVNQWAATFAQPAAFQTTPPALQSVVIQLNPASSVGGGTGTATAGNWLFACAGWRQQNPVLADIRAAVSDDVHSWWRPVAPSPGKWVFTVNGTPSSQSFFICTTAQAAGITAGDRFTDTLNPGITFTVTAIGAPAFGFQNISFTPPAPNAMNANDVVSQAGATRTYISYTPNLARAPQYVYIAPTASAAGISVLVTEIAGLGPWDTVTGTYANYAAAAMSLNLALGAPSGPAFLLGAVTGDLSTAGQSFSPATWNPLHTVTATDGSDTLCDTVLTSAWIATSSAISVNATASSPEDMSGAVVGVLQSALSPVPAGVNPSWPWLRVEAAFGSGFQAPPDQLTWTDITSRVWSWDEQTGIQFQLGQLQAANLTLELDNVDGALNTGNLQSPYVSAALNANVSFETGVSPWTPLNGATLAQSAAFSFLGSFSLLLTPDGVSATPGADAEKFPVTAGANYTATAWAYCVPGYGSGAQVSINWYTRAGTYISTSNPAFATALPAAQWTQLSVQNVTAPGGAGYGQIQLQVSGTPASSVLVYFDNAIAVAGAAAAVITPLTTGIPVRIRAAIGTVAGVTANRWYVISRNVESWPEKIDTPLRRYAALTATDLWSVLNADALSAYRAEVYQDAPYAEWAMDDQPGVSGVLPVSLVNSAPGNTNVLTVQPVSGGVTSGDAYTTTGVNATQDGVISAPIQPGNPPPSIAVYNVGQQSGWMYGDPQSSPASYDTGNPVSSSAGSAAWQQSGLLGTGGSNTWFLTCNDSNFPALAAGITFGLWFSAAFFGTAAGFTDIHNVKYDLAGQPYSVITLATLATASAPVAILQLDLSGHLSFITYNGATPTASAIYSTSDLRSASFHHVMVTMTATAWTVYVDGGMTAAVSGTATGMTSAWSWLVINGDLGSSGGSGLGNIENGGNVAYAHAQVFGHILPPWRVRAHYCAAITAFGLLPAPQALQLQTVANQFAGTSYTPDGTEFQGQYGHAAGAILSFTFSAVAVAQAGSFTSGPSARTIIAGLGHDVSGTFFGNAVWLGLAGLSPATAIFTGSAANTETNAATVCGSGDSFTTGFGAGATGNGVCQTAAGTGASPPAASALGDTAGQRIERLFSYGFCNSPLRSIDPSAQPVQAATQIGGQAASDSIQQVQQSDDGMLYIDNTGSLVYWQRSHLASQYSSPAWKLGPETSLGQIPYGKDIEWVTDPQRIQDAIAITPFEPDNSLPQLVVPQNYQLVQQLQRQYGAQPLQITSVLQSRSEMQAQADWRLAMFGQPRRRASNVRISAVSYPAAWQLVLGVNVGDVVTIEDWQAGGGGAVWTYRVTQIQRTISFGGRDGQVRGDAVLTCDWEPPSYWT